MISNTALNSTARLICSCRLQGPIDPDPAESYSVAPTKFEFVINLTAAKQIGLTIPPNVQARADKAIE